MTRFLLISSVLLAGCFYIDPINQRPSLEINNPTSEIIERGTPGVSVTASVFDPEGQIVRLSWRVYACDDAANTATCDPTPLRESSDAAFTFDAPVRRANNTPANSMLVELEGIDDLGARARPSQQLIIPLANAKPKITTSHQSSYGKTVGTPIDVFAVFGDFDDDLATVTLDYKLFPPSASTAQLEPVCPLLPGGVCPAPDDTTKEQDGIRFTPDVTGEWRIQVTARDPNAPSPTSVDGDEGTTVVLETVVVVVDQLPCIGPISPAAPPPSSQLPVSEPTLFQVHQVIDAIDPYPSNVTDQILGQSEFHWSMSVNSGTRQTLATETGNSVAFDPEAFTPGDTVELRVEIADRGSPFPLTCDPNEQTCQLDPTLVPACLQRQTWKVVVQ